MTQRPIALNGIQGGLLPGPSATTFQLPAAPAVEPGKEPPTPFLGLALPPRPKRSPGRKGWRRLFKRESKRVGSEGATELGDPGWRVAGVGSPRRGRGLACGVWESGRGSRPRQVHWQGQGNSGAPEREAQPGRRVSVEPEVCRSGLRSQAGGGCSIWTASWKGPRGTVDRSVKTQGKTPGNSQPVSLRMGQNRGLLEAPLTQPHTPRPAHTSGGSEKEGNGHVLEQSLP